MKVTFCREILLRSFHLELERTDTIVTVKDKIRMKKVYLPYQYGLEYEGEELKDDKRMIDYGIGDGSVVFIKWKQKEIEDKMEKEYKEIIKHRQLLFDQERAAIHQMKAAVDQKKAAIDELKASHNTSNVFLPFRNHRSTSMYDPFNAIYSVSDFTSLEIARASTGVSLNSFAANVHSRMDSLIDGFVENCDQNKRSSAQSDVVLPAESYEFVTSNGATVTEEIVRASLPNSEPFHQINASLFVNVANVNSKMDSLINGSVKNCEQNKRSSAQSDVVLPAESYEFVTSNGATITEEIVRTSLPNSELFHQISASLFVNEADVNNHKDSLIDGFVEHNDRNKESELQSDEFVPAGFDEFKTSNSATVTEEIVRASLPQEFSVFENIVIPSADGSLGFNDCSKDSEPSNPINNSLSNATDSNLVSFIDGSIKSDDHDKESELQSDEVLPAEFDEFETSNGATVIEEIIRASLPNSEPFHQINASLCANATDVNINMDSFIDGSVKSDDHNKESELQSDEVLPAEFNEFETSNSVAITENRMSLPKDSSVMPSSNVSFGFDAAGFNHSLKDSEPNDSIKDFEPSSEAIFNSFQDDFDTFLSPRSQKLDHGSPEFDASVVEVYADRSPMPHGSAIMNASVIFDKETPFKGIPIITLGLTPIRPNHETFEESIFIDDYFITHDDENVPNSSINESVIYVKQTPSKTAPVVAVGSTPIRRGRMIEPTRYIESLETFMNGIGADYDDSSFDEENFNRETDRDESYDDRYFLPLKSPMIRSIHCNCKTGCRTRSCTCVKNKQDCSIRCHRNYDCMNGTY